MAKVITQDAPAQVRANAQGTALTAKTRSGKRRRGRKLKESVILDRKGRKIGSDDLMEAARLCKWAEHTGLRRNLVPVANAVGLGLEEAVNLSLRGQHREAAMKAKNVMFVLNKEFNEAVANIKVDCRDSRVRKIVDITKWYAGVHFRIADDIEKAQAAEAEAELERLQRRAAKLAREQAEEAAKTASEESEVKVA